MEQLGIGLVGAGFMGKTHANAYHTIPYIFWPRTFELRRAAVCDAVDDKAREAAARYDFAKYYTDYREMLLDPDIQVVDICGPDPTHFEVAMAAIGQGKHVYCEKPIAMTSAQALEMYRAAEQKGVKHMAGFNYRFFPANLLAKELIQKGAIGEITHTRFLYAQAYGASRELLAEDIFYDNSGKANGVGQAIGCHVIDLARWFAGEITHLMGKTAIYCKERKTRDGGTRKMTGEDGSYALVDFDSGATGMLESTQVSGGRHNYLFWDIAGSEGSMQFDLEKPNYLWVSVPNKEYPEINGFTEVNVTQEGHPYAGVWWAKGHNIGWEHGHINALAHFFNCIAQDSDIAPMGGTFYDGYKSEAVLEAIRQSSDQGRGVDVVY